ncbi:MAG: DUF3536 domain-containing protein [Candidatus Binataceae bacterium]
MDEPRYIIIHGHFYQPPRESPWTGLIAHEVGAAPFPNWNERILSECYNANAHAHIMDGRVVHIRNNFEQLNFDFGPTLISWLERHGKAAYHGIRRGDELSRERLTGGNAIAQSYNHSILPLLTERDRTLQVSWGVHDFVYRFGRQPHGMWLPECGADDDTLATLARAGIRFVILGAGQGRYHKEGAQERDAGPFMWRREELSLAVFRYDPQLSGELAFSEALNDGAALAESLARTAFSMPPGAGLLLATDGETFGHHKRGGAAELARALAILETRDGLELTNCEAYLAAHPAGGNFLIDAPSSWSCPHGVERWRANCGCRMDLATSQEWRAPLRAAMELVNNHVASVYGRFAGALLKQPEEALRESPRMLLDSWLGIREEFFARYGVPEESAQERLLRMFEMERAAQAALTSCAWFFDDFGGPEGRIVLKWAGRAIELAAELTPSIEAELLADLRHIRSNRREIGDAASLYLSVKTREARGRV